MADSNFVLKERCDEGRRKLVDEEESLLPYVRILPLQKKKDGTMLYCTYLHRKPVIHISYICTHE